MKVIVVLIELLNSLAPRTQRACIFKKNDIGSAHLHNIRKTHNHNKKVSTSYIEYFMRTFANKSRNKKKCKTICSQTSLFELVGKIKRYRLLMYSYNAITLTVFMLESNIIVLSYIEILRAHKCLLRERGDKKIIEVAIIIYNQKMLGTYC